ncbi:MAG: NADH-quinone oxidoreductase subunit C [Pyrinomonadaceae bacterium]|nr:NADH-quinone oxidoreductase subunit C [Pyrinomonadaceae bacterium]
MLKFIGTPSLTRGPPQNCMTEKLHAFVDKLKSENEGWVTSVAEAFDEVTVTVPRESIVDVCRFLRDEQGFDLLADLCGCDRGPEEDPRFEVNYHLFSTTHYSRLRLKVLLGEDAANVTTVTQIWKTADWHERETYDLVGIKFDGHPDLRRILLPSDFDGHALRKDYPLRGYEPYSLN